MLFRVLAEQAKIESLSVCGENLLLPFVNQAVLDMCYILPHYKTPYTM